MFATIRFYIEPTTGQHIEQHFMLQTGEVIVASQIAKSICDGYTLGTGLSAYVLSIYGTSNGDVKNTVTSPVDMAHFGNELRDFIEKSPTNQHNKTLKDIVQETRITPDFKSQANAESVVQRPEHFNEKA